MEKIIAEELEVLKRLLEKIYEKVPSLEETDRNGFEACRTTMCRINERYAEFVDDAIRHAKAERKKEGIVIERRNDPRTYLTLNGEMTFNHTYYALADGTYGYLADQVLGIEPHQRIGEEVCLGLVREALSNSYSKASGIVTSGMVSSQTVMNSIRRCRAKETPETEAVPIDVLHIDADEDHVSMQNGRTRIVPLISVYEGIETIGSGDHPRHRCRNVFHYSEPSYNEDFWDNALYEIEKKYDLTHTTVYVHGDGARWIKEGLMYFKKSVFVLDGYHKNKAKKAFFSGNETGGCLKERAQLNKAFTTGDREQLLEAWRSRMAQNPEHGDSITDAMNYLCNNLEGIHVRYTDPEARNGGATEPHVSHVLSARLSSRPMGWSNETLKCLVPMLARREIECVPRDTEKASLPVITLSAAKSAMKVGMKRKRTEPLLVDPDNRGRNIVISNGQLTALYRTIKGLSR